MNRLGVFAVMLLLLIVIGANGHIYGQSKVGKPLTMHLRELADKHKIKISFSPSITDHIWLETAISGSMGDPVKILTELLKNSGMTFRRVGPVYTVIKDPNQEEVELPAAVKKPMPAKVAAQPKKAVIARRIPREPIATIKLAVPELTVPPHRIVIPKLAIMPQLTTEQISKKRVNWLAVKTNLLYGGYAFTPNLGVEFGLGRRTTLDVAGSYNWFNLDGVKNNNKKLVHWIVQPEFRYFLCERFNGHFFGVHALYSRYNIGGHNLPLLFGRGSADFRHEGWAAGLGVTYGYQFMLGKRWNLELSAGLGYANLQYDKYDCPKCSSKIGVEKKNYFGPTKAAISLIYIIK